MPLKKDAVLFQYENDVKISQKSQKQTNFEL